MHYYNEFNPEAAAMIKQFMVDGLIPHGDVDTRPIQEVEAHELKGYTQCHFFAGIAGWQFALQLAGWSADRPVWTGSCPCQPFSSAGRQKGKDDERHLWPVWQRLIKECSPPTIFGEQVASAVTHGWLDDVYEGLEGEGYAVGAAVLPACGVGAPHKRDRLWFVAHSQSERDSRAAGASSQAVERPEADNSLQFGRTDAGTRAVGNTKQSGLEGHARHGQDSHEPGWLNAQQARPAWEAGVWIPCPDGKQRLIEPSIPLLVDGFPHRKPILHALGNAIVPQVAAQFIRASM